MCCVACFNDEANRLVIQGVIHLRPRQEADAGLVDFGRWLPAPDGEKAAGASLGSANEDWNWLRYPMVGKSGWI